MLSLQVLYTKETDLSRLIQYDHPCTLPPCSSGTQHKRCLQLESQCSDAQGSTPITDANCNGTRMCPTVTRRRKACGLKLPSGNY